MADAPVVRSYPFGPVNGLDIDPKYAWLQEHEPLARVRLPYGEEGWLLTRFDDVRTALTDPRFSLAQAVIRDVPRLTEQRAGAGLTDLDPPEHTRLRRLVTTAFTARRVERLRARAERIAAELVDTMVRAGPPADLMAAVAVPLPGLMICELVGVPYADRERFQEWVAAFMSITALTAEERMAQMGALAGYLGELAARRREDPADDLLSARVHAQVDEDRLTETEVVELTVQLLAAGYESTASQLGDSVYALATQPGQLALLQARPELIPNAIEELLRWVPLLVTADVLPRYAVADVELSGGTVRAGEPVLLAKHAANRDPRVFDDPDRLDVTRVVDRQLGFGLGPHHCLGAQLARLDLQVALATLLDRCPALRVDADVVRWKTGFAVRSPTAVPITW